VKVQPHLSPGHSLKLKRALTLEALCEKEEFSRRLAGSLHTYALYEGTLIFSGSPDISLGASDISLYNV